MAIIDLDDSDVDSTQPPQSSFKPYTIDLSSEHDDLPDIGDLRPLKRARISPVAPSRRSALLEQFREAAVLPTTVDKGKGRARDESDDTETSTVTSSKAPKAKRQKLTYEEKAERDAEKKAAAQAKKDATAAAREAKKKQAEIDKAQKKAETAANIKSKGRSEECLNLRIIFAECLATAKDFQPIYDSVKSQLLEDSKIKAIETDDREELPIIKWYRDCTDSWDVAEGMFKPHTNNKVIVEREPTILLYVKAKELSTIENLLHRVATARSQHGGSMVQVFVLVEGVKKYKTQEKSHENATLRARLDGKASPTKKNKGPTVDDIEMALMRLQLIEKCHILQPNTANDTIRWLIELTKDIGARRKRLIEKSHLDRLGISGNKPDMKYQPDDLKNGYIAMLTSMYHIGEGYARSIANKYPTLRRLYEAFERLPDGAERERMLMGIPKGQNKDGQKSKDVMGEGLSKRVYRQLFEENPQRMMASMSEVKKRKATDDLGQTRLTGGNFFVPS